MLCDKESHSYSIIVLYSETLLVVSHTKIPPEDNN
jgi:hypothetical protein